MTELKYTLTFTGDELADIEEALRYKQGRAHGQADSILTDESLGGEVRATRAKARRQHGNRLGVLADRVHDGREYLWRY
jgi:hypothetical protein